MNIDQESQGEVVEDSKDTVAVTMKQESWYRLSKAMVVVHPPRDCSWSHNAPHSIDGVQCPMRKQHYVVGVHYPRR